MKRGFTSIEVIGALFALCIILIPLFNLTSMLLDNRFRNEYQDEEYNLASSICEMFKSEALPSPNRQVVFFLDNLNELTLSVNDMLIAGNTIENTDLTSLTGLNFSLKRYAIILNSYTWEKLKFITVKIESMRKPSCELTLRVGI